MRSERYRWVLACNLFAILTVSSGLGFYNLSVYMHALAAQRGFAVSAVSNAVGLFFLMGGVSGLLVGRVLQRRDARLVMLVGTLFSAGSIACIGWVRAEWQMYLVFALFGVGYTGISVLPATTLITRWFDPSRRPVALSFSSTGLSLGGVVLTPLTAALLERWPLQNAMPMLGAIFVLLIVPVVWFGIRSFPAVSAGAPSLMRQGTAFSLAVRSRFFVVLTMGYVLAMGAQVGVIAHMYGRGVAIATPLQASFAVSVLATLSVIGRLLGGFLVGRIPIKGFTLTMVVGQLFGFVLIGFADDAMDLWLGAALFGFTVGNLLMLQPLMLAQAFGVMDYPRIFSVSQAVSTLGIASGPVLLGAITAAHGYLVAFLTFAVLSGVAFALIVAAGPVPEGDAAR